MCSRSYYMFILDVRLGGCIAAVVEPQPGYLGVGPPETCVLSRSSTRKKSPERASEAVAAPAPPATRLTSSSAMDAAHKPSSSHASVKGAPTTRNVAPLATITTRFTNSHSSGKRKLIRLSPKGCKGGGSSMHGIYPKREGCGRARSEGESGERWVRYTVAPKGELFDKYAGHVRVFGNACGSRPKNVLMLLNAYLTRSPREPHVLPPHSSRESLVGETTAAAFSANEIGGEERRVERPGRDAGHTCFSGSRFLIQNQLVWIHSLRAAHKKQTVKHTPPPPRRGGV